MSHFLNKLGLIYLAGALGGLAYALAAWACGAWGLYPVFGVHITSDSLTWAYLSDRLLYGSLWSLLLLVLAPILTVRGITLGLILSLIPTGYTLFLHYPLQHLGFFGTAQGSLAWMFILAFNAIWGVVTSWIYSTQGRA